MQGLVRVFEWFLGPDRGFFSTPGELHLRFDPHWPGPLMGGAGAPLNYVLALLALALFAVLWRRRGPWSRWAIAARVGLVLLFFSAISGGLAWNVSLAAA